MTEAGPAKALSNAQSDLQTGAERRRFRRVPLDLPGRLFLPAEGREAPCNILDMSPGGAGITCDIVPPLGSAVVLYQDSFGRFEGHVVRCDPAGFGLAFACTPSKRERIAEQLILFLNRSPEDDGLLRRHGRSNRFAKFTRADGQIVHCEVSDISVNGVSLKTSIRPAIGEFVLIAQIAGRVARYHEDGISIDFVGNEKHAMESASRKNAAG